MARPMIMTATVGDVTIVYLQEARILDAANISALGEQLLELVEQSYKPALLIDFAKVAYLSSAVLGKLVAVKKAVDRAKGRLALASIKNDIKEIFRITKLDRVFEIHDDERSAMNAFRTKALRSKRR